MNVTRVQNKKKGWCDEEKRKKMQGLINRNWCLSGYWDY